MATFTLPYRPTLWREMKEKDEPTHYDFIAQVLEKDKETKHEVCWNLVQPFIGEGAPSIHDFEITSVDFSDGHLLNGTVDVEFMVDIYFGCDGMDSQHDRSDTMAFKIDPSSKTITFTVTEPERRDTIEEF